MTEKIQEAKEYLTQIRKTDRLIQRLDETVCNLRRSLTSRGHTLWSEKVQTFCSEDRIGDTVAKIDELEREINQHMDNIIEMKRDAFQIIAKIPDLDQQNILVARYIQIKDWDDIALEFDREITWVYRMHGMGLIAFAKLMK